MDVRTSEFQKLMRAKKTVNKLQENIVKSTMKLYRQRSSPYKLVRNKPVKDVGMSNSCCSQPSVAIKDERTMLLQKLMNLTETVQRMREYLIKSQIELYRRKSSPYVWIRPRKMTNEK
eukprot:XP_016659355.1 PREDICTED: uncharacterized protein LOC107883598 [Acyrthosiphon pisum]